jgi:hypothetical protein
MRDSLPAYAPELAAFRILGVSYEFGSKLLKIGVLTPDARLISGRPLFSAARDDIERHKREIMAHKRKVAAAKYNVGV